MESGTDTRIPILLNATPTPADAVLLEDGQNMPETGYVLRFAPGLPGHAIGCACCAPRGPAADALGKMFRERATGAAPFFKRVVVVASAEGEAAVRAAVDGDVMTKARYRI
jgi:hypothetical protein